ncbi:MAG: DUF433 domain-containing protein [Gemmatimonas sp.]|nr:DUF433 domain-containing protein [Gemmatimonas sp.]
MRESPQLGDLHHHRAMPTTPPVLHRQPTTRRIRGAELTILWRGYKLILNRGGVMEKKGYYKGRRRPGKEVVASVNEAAFVAGVSKHAVNQAIDRGEIRARRVGAGSEASGRALGGPELVYLRVQEPLSARARREVYRRLSRLSIEDVPSVLEMENAVKLDIREPLAEVRARLKEIDWIKRQMETNPNIRGGEPVFRGTRIPVHMIADFLKQGVPRTEILEDYPALTTESLTVAERYAAFYPRRGRPKRAPWRSRSPTHVFGPDELHG